MRFYFIEKSNAESFCSKMQERTVSENRKVGKVKTRGWFSFWLRGMNHRHFAVRVSSDLDYISHLAPNPDELDQKVINLAKSLDGEFVGYEY